LGRTVFAALIAAALATAMLAARLPGAVRIVASGGLVRGDDDFQAVAQAVGAVDDHALAR
jgi:hypothetical protein